MSQLVSSRKTFDFRNDKELINALANVPDILFVVMNQEAIWLILEHNGGKTNDGDELKTPATVKRMRNAPKSQKKPGIPNVPPVDQQRQRESMSVLKQWGRENGMDIDDRYPLTPGTVNDLLKKKGKGKLSQKRRLKWESLF